MTLVKTSFYDVVVIGVLNYCQWAISKKERDFPKVGTDHTAIVRRDEIISVRKFKATGAILIRRCNAVFPKVGNGKVAARG